MKHMIVLSSSYSTFERIGYHIALDENFDTKYNLFKEKAKEIGATYQYSPYVYTADNWEDEIRTNLFYENVRMISDLDEFISLIEKGLKINALHVAYYILSREKCTHLRLQRLIILCYKDYFDKINEKLFEEEIEYCSIGPFVKSVFQKFGNNKIMDLDFVIEKNYHKTAELCRIAFAINGFDMIKSIDYILEKYKNYDTKDLLHF